MGATYLVDVLQLEMPQGDALISVQKPEPVCPHKFSCDVSIYLKRREYIQAALLLG